MDVGRRRGNGVVSGSVWDNRIKLYDGKGGIKALINTSQTEQSQNSPETMNEIQIPLQEDKKLAMATKPRSPTVVAASGKRKSWKSESLEGNPLQSPRKRSELCKNIEDLSKKTRSVLQKQKGPELRKVKSESSKLLNDDNGNGKLRNSNSLQLVKAKSASPKDLDDGRSSRKELKFEENKEQETKNFPVSEDSHSFSRPQSRLQSLVDLVMWRDASKSALVFGIGTFLIISSSYTQDIKVSLVSVVSYMSLLYLAVIFLFRSLIHRGGRGVGERSEYVVGEEEAIWVLRLILPSINEFLLKIRALFSGDPATTMKMAVLLFVLAQCGSSITIWKMAKLAFMLYVAFRYYQESMVREGWDGERAEEEEAKIGQRQVGRMSTFMDTTKQKKPF
nr:reticulon-like protein B21 isoform X2 [Ipomoea batatas]